MMIPGDAIDANVLRKGCREDPILIDEDEETVGAGEQVSSRNCADETDGHGNVTEETGETHYNQVSGTFDASMRETIQNNEDLENFVRFVLANMLEDTSEYGQIEYALKIHNYLQHGFGGTLSDRICGAPINVIYKVLEDYTCEVQEIDPTDEVWDDERDDDLFGS